MAMIITEDCTSCAACESECPNDAISEGDDQYVIEATKCTECVGAYDEPQCVEACPVGDTIIKDPNLNESHEVLMARYESLH